MDRIHSGKAEQRYLLSLGSRVAVFALCLLYLHLCIDALSRLQEVEDVQMVLDSH